MFPNDNADITVKNIMAQVDIAKSVLLSLSFDFDKKEYIVKDGSPVLVSEYEATKQWIEKFLSTDINTLEIYEGYKFGTSYKKLLGSKDFNNGFAESEIEREIREGFLLCPSINKVISYEASKEGTKLCLRIGVALNDGASLECNATLGV